MALVVGRYEALITLRSHISLGLCPQEMTSSDKQTFTSPYNKVHKCIMQKLFFHIVLHYISLYDLDKNVIQIIIYHH